MKFNTHMGFSPLLTRAAFFSALWWLLTEGDARSWVVGGPITLAATMLSLRLRPERSWHWRLAGVLPMAWFFLRESVHGGFDVARRALARSLPLNPGLLRFDTQLPAGTARLFFAGLISLLPGTLALGIGEDELRIHALDADAGVEVKLRTLEQLVAALFGIELRATGEARQ